MKRISKNLVSLTLISVVLTSCAQSDWVNLFNGENLDGWKRLNGEAEYVVKDGVIIGTPKLKTPNTFLVYEQEFADFILEFEFKIDDEFNSGVQFRSHTRDNKPDGRVYGYQFEIDPSDRAWSAGIFDEARNGWLNPLTENPAAQAAFKSNDWNTARIEAIGTSIRTWINGVPAADLIANYDASGIIALQVHSIGKKEQLEKSVSWRNIRITENVEKYRSAENTPSVPQYNRIDNTLSDREKKDGWKLLWDGKTTNGWRGAKIDEFPNKGWKVENGELIVLSSKGAESANGGDIVTDKKYTDFELSVDFKLTKGANSGIKYFVDTELNKGKGSAIGCEFQILDDKNHPDAKQGNDGNRKLGSLYDIMPAPAQKRVNGGYNTAKVIVKGNHVEHWLNSFKLLEYDRNTPEWNKMVNKSKYKTWPNFGNASSGHILLQDHGDEVRFKNVKIKEL